MTIPSDPLNRWWCEVSGENATAVASRRPALITLVAFGRQREPKVLGTGFIVGGSPDAVLVVTAKHVLMPGALGIQKPEALAQLSNPFAPTHGNAISLDKRALRGLWHDVAGSSMLELLHVNYNESLDVALCVLSPSDGSAIRPTAIPLHPRYPPLGARIQMTSLSHKEIIETAPPTAPNGTGQGITVSNHVSIRVGIVTGVYPDGYRQYRWPCFTTSIPAAPGMSGGLVSLFSEGHPLAACGVICADVSAPGASNDPMILGMSIIGCTWPMFGMSVPRTYPITDTAERCSLLEAVNLGLVVVDGVDHLRVEPTGDFNYSITYERD